MLNIGTKAFRKRRRIEEIINTSTSGVGVLIAIACTVILVVRAALLGDAWHIVTFSIFGAGMINLYVSSTLFHGAKDMRRKLRLNIFDHSSIYVLIAATYTPISLVSLRGPVGWVLFGLIWALAIGGIIFKVWFYSSKYRTLSAIMYLGMGMLIVFAIGPIIRYVPTVSLWFLLAGCLSYAFGVIFYVKKEWPFGHGVFHLFVMGGSITHFFAMFFML